MLATLAFTGIIAAALVEGFYLFRKDGKLDPLSPLILAAAALLLLLELARRSLAIRFLAITSLYESLLLYAAGLAAIIVAYRYQKRLPFRPVLAFAATVLDLGLLALSSSPLAPSALLPPIPALRSGWLVLHVSFAFIGEAFFAAAALASLAYLLSRDAERRQDYDRFAYTAIAAGYPVYTLGALIFGAIWAQTAWGRWWSWDPKEVWAAVTWLVYTAFLHLRLVAGQKGRRMALLSLIGFALTLFTLFGVNFLIKGGLHSYS